MTKGLQTPPGYTKLLRELKERIRTAQVRAALAVNRELILLYWSIGRDILAKQQQAGWGRRSLIGWHVILDQSSLAWKVSVLEI